MKIAHTINNRRVEGGVWGELAPIEIDCGDGVIGVTTYAQLVQIDENRLFNPANGDILYRTRKDKEQGIAKHYFSKDTGILVNAWMISEINHDE